MRVGVSLPRPAFDERLAGLARARRNLRHSFTLHGRWKVCIKTILGTKCAISCSHTALLTSKFDQLSLGRSGSISEHIAVSCRHTVKLCEKCHSLRKLQHVYCTETSMRAGDRRKENLTFKVTLVFSSCMQPSSSTCLFLAQKCERDDIV